MNSGTNNDMKYISSFKKCKQLKKYSWDSKSSHKNSPSLLDDLLKAEIISGKELLVLKEQNLMTYNPKVVMDLRHEQVKRNRQSNNNQFSKHDIREEAKRFIRSEDRKAALHKKEQMLIDKEIGALKQQLDKIKIMIKQESHNQTLLRSKNMTAKHSSNLCNNNLFEDSDVLHIGSSSDFQLQCPKTSDEIISQTESSVNCSSVREKTLNVPFEEVPLVKMISQTERSVSCSSVHENNVNILSEEVPLANFVDANTNPKNDGQNSAIPGVSVIDYTAALAKQMLLRSTLKKWINYTSAQRLFAQVENNIFETDHKNLLAKYWQRWCTCTRQRFHHNVSRHSEKIINPEKIEKFIKSLHEKKLYVQNCNRGKLYSKHKSHTLSSQTRKTNKFDNKFGSEIYLTSKNISTNQHRLIAQRNIITDQKAEIEKKNRLIEELRLVNLKLEAEKSCTEANSNLRKVQLSCNITLKAKANALVHGLSVLSNEDQVASNHSSAIVMRMEKRRKERERKWQLIKEKKKCLEEEKEQKLLKEEAERKLKEDEEKISRIMAFREKCRIEKENKLKRQTEREELQELYVKAANHYNRHLLNKYSIGRWLALITVRKNQMDSAVSYHNTKLSRKYIFTWRIFAQQSIALKVNMAIVHYERRLLQLCFRCLLTVYDDSIRDGQVASDYYELKLLERTFSCWHQWICDQHLDMAYKHSRAVEHAERRLLASCLGKWRQFPRVVQLDREREKRKYAWRRKVQELLPDFKPPSPV